MASELRTKVATVQEGQLKGTYDVILLSCKAYDLDGAMDAISPGMSERSVIVPLLERGATYRSFKGEIWCRSAYWAASLSLMQP